MYYMLYSYSTVICVYICVSYILQDCLPQDEVVSVGRNRKLEQYGYDSKQAYFVQCPSCSTITTAAATKSTTSGSGSDDIKPTYTHSEGLLVDRPVTTSTGEGEGEVAEEEDDQAEEPVELLPTQSLRITWTEVTPPPPVIPTPRPASATAKAAKKQKPRQKQTPSRRQVDTPTKSTTEEGDGVEGGEVEKEEVQLSPKKRSTRSKPTITTTVLKEAADDEEKEGEVKVNKKTSTRTTTTTAAAAAAAASTTAKPSAAAQYTLAQGLDQLCSHDLASQLFTLPTTTTEGAAGDNESSGGSSSSSGSEGELQAARKSLSALEAALTAIRLKVDRGMCLYYPPFFSQTHILHFIYTCI